MDPQLIEKEDALRYKLLLLRTIGSFFFIGGMLAIFATFSLRSSPLTLVLGTVALLGCALMVYAAMRLARWLKRIRKQPELKNALYNEMYMHYEYLAASRGFYAMIGLAWFLGSSTTMFTLSTQAACYLVLFGGVMVASICQLIFHRR